MRKLLGIFYKAVIIIFLIISVLAFTGFIIGKIYKEEIQNYAISEINNELDVKVKIRSADLSVLGKFPFVSIVLYDAVALCSDKFDANEFSGFSTDTLFSASRIYLQFNLLDIISKNYRLRKVHLLNGKLNIFVDSYGGVNYRIFKTINGNGKSNLNLWLDKVKMSGFSWLYVNLAKDIQSEGQLKDIELKGNFSNTRFSLNSRASFFIKSFKREGIEYASQLNVFSRLILNVQDSIFTVSTGELSLNDLNFKIRGTFYNSQEPYVDMQIAGEKLNINSLISALPLKHENFDKYSVTGSAEILAKIKGKINNIYVPSIRAAFKISNGNFTLPTNHRNIRNMSIRGTYSNGSRHNASTSRINLSEYKVAYGQNNLKGHISIDNFLNPFISVSTSGTITASELSDLIDFKDLKLTNGSLTGNISLNATLNSLNDIRNLHTTLSGINGSIEFIGVSGEIPYSDLPLDLLEGTLKIQDETWQPEIIVKLGNNEGSANLIILNLWDFIVNKSKLPQVNGDMFFKYLSVKDFIPESGSSADSEFHLPDSIYLNLHCRADSFIYGKFHAAALETWFNYKPGLLSVSSLAMNTMKGNATTAGVIIADSTGQMMLRSTGKLDKIDITELFYAFNNFSQNFIVSKNMKGSVSGTFDFSTYINPKLELITKNLYAQSDFIINNGELIDFEPIMELSSYVDLSELKHIKFSTLKNSIVVKDENCFIPQMDINSSAFNITLSGTHSFNNYFDYKLRLSLNEFLSSKFKKGKKEDPEFGAIEDDGSGNTNIYLSIIGTPDNFKVKYDKKEAIGKIKSNLIEEKKILKTILKEELGLFKNDTIKTANPQTNSNKFILDWGDDNLNKSKPENTVKGKKSKKSNPEFEVTWDDEDPVLP